LATSGIDNIKVRPLLCNCCQSRAASSKAQKLTDVANSVSLASGHRSCDPVRLV
ncbi:MAG: hypothetical protein RIS44_3062, partial [Pseudomonadota bacterium]